MKIESSLEGTKTLFIEGDMVLETGGVISTKGINFLNNLLSSNKKEIGGQGMDFIKQVAADVLGVEWDDGNGRSENFEIINNDGKTLDGEFYLLSGYGLYKIGCSHTYPLILEELLCGEYTIFKELTYGEEYYVIHSGWERGYCKFTWKNSEYDKKLLRLDRIIRTEKQAKEEVEVLSKELGWKVE